MPDPLKFLRPQHAATAKKIVAEQIQRAIILREQENLKATKATKKHANTTD
jgi:hypothetical protein